MLKTTLDIGEHLRSVRDGIGLTQAELAHLCGLRTSAHVAMAVSTWERGERIKQLVRDAPLLMRILGPEAWKLGRAAWCCLNPRDRADVKRVMKALFDVLAKVTAKKRRARLVERPDVEFDMYCLDKWPGIDAVAKAAGYRSAKAMGVELSVSGLVELQSHLRMWAAIVPDDFIEQETWELVPGTRNVH